MRIDTLSQALALANIGAHSVSLVVEECGGLVTAAAAARLAGEH